MSVRTAQDRLAAMLGELHHYVAAAIVAGDHAPSNWSAEILSELRACGHATPMLIAAVGAWDRTTTGKAEDCARFEAGFHAYDRAECSACAVAAFEGRGNQCDECVGTAPPCVPEGARVATLFPGAVHAIARDGAWSLHLRGFQGTLSVLLAATAKHHGWHGALRAERIAGCSCGGVTISLHRGI